MAGTYFWTGLSAKTVANYFLELGRRDWVAVDPLKLQKLVYLAHGWSLQFLQRPLIRLLRNLLKLGVTGPWYRSYTMSFGDSGAGQSPSLLQECPANLPTE
jgi:uncharacterized phage-associated protein